MNASSSLFGWLILLSSFDPPVWSASISQHTDGSCSPAVADVKGNVTITCNGMDQATVNKVISLLMLIRLFQQDSTYSVRGWRGLRFPVVFVNSSASSPAKRPVRSIWLTVVGRTDLSVRGVGTSVRMS